jgi:aerobic-type carbon monoxide dehydrogenase small subunit (CoxS/CutS family)
MEDKFDASSVGENEKKNKGISRRGFLRGAGITTAGTVVLNSGLLAGSSSINLSDSNKTLGPGIVPVSLKVNGHIHAVTVEPSTTLAQVLREHLQLTGTKVVCDRGSCSACTVWLDGMPVNSCMVLIMDVGDKEVTTIEGLSKTGELHPLQDSFIQHDAMQCGFCSPGMIMTGAHLLKKNPKPSLHDVKIAYRGNLCRCGTHPNVFKATLDASKKQD